MGPDGFPRVQPEEVARRAGISSGHLSQIMNGQRTPSGEVLKKLHGVLFQPSAAELVVPAEVKVMARKKGGRNGVVVRGAGGPGAGSQAGGGTIRIGGRVPWGAEVEYVDIKDILLGTNPIRCDCPGRCTTAAEESCTIGTMRKD